MLTDTAARNAKAAPKAYKLTDAQGLHLLVSVTGFKSWRLKYRWGGKEGLATLGHYPAMSLKQAREARDNLRRELMAGINPATAKRAAKLNQLGGGADSFEQVAREWYGDRVNGWSQSHRTRMMALFENDLFPWLGKQSTGQITAPELLQVARRIQARGSLEMAHRAVQLCGQVFRYAIVTGRATRDVSQDLRGALPVYKGGHFAAVTEPEPLAELLRVTRHYRGSNVVRAALQLAPLVFVRPNELRTAKWADIDLVTAQWRYLVSKTQTPHIVPLSTQAVAILRELQPLTGRGVYVFPSERVRDGSRPMSDNAVLSALRRLGVGKDTASGHGFRATARTLLDEVLQFPAHLIEHQLAHAVRDPLGRAYNRTTHLVERTKMMQAWADYLDGLVGRQ